MRLFTAIDLPEAMKDRLTEICYGVPRIRWGNPAQFHLTLVFIGEVNPALVEDIEEELATIDFEPFEINCQGIGSFRNGALWIDVENSPELDRLQQQIRFRLRAVNGVRIESQRFRPHITLGKFDIQAPPLLDNFLSLNNADRYSFTASSFQLKSSQLNPKGAIHRVLAEYSAFGKSRPQQDNNEADGLSVREQLRMGKMR